MEDRLRLSVVEQFVLDGCRSHRTVEDILADARNRGYNVSLNLVLDAVRYVVKEAGLQPVVYTIEQGSFCWTCPQCGGYVIREDRPGRTVQCDNPYCRAELWYSGVTGDLVPYCREHHALQNAVDSLQSLLGELSDTADLMRLPSDQTGELLDKLRDAQKNLREALPSWDEANGS